MVREKKQEKSGAGIEEIRTVGEFATERNDYLSLERFDLTTLEQQENDPLFAIFFEDSTTLL